MRVVHFEDVKTFLDATKSGDDSFTNFALGALLDSMDESQAQSQARWGPKTRTLLGVYKGDELIITLTKCAQDFNWVITTTRNVCARLEATDVSKAVILLSAFLPTVIDPNTLGKVIGPEQLVGPFLNAWVSLRNTQGHDLTVLEPSFTARTGYASLSTLPPVSPAFAAYAISQGETQADIDVLTPLYVEHSRSGPRAASLEEAKALMSDAVHARDIWLTRIEGSIAGYILIGRKTPRTVAIRNVFMIPEHRRRGIAEAMVRAVTRYYLGAEPLGFEGAPKTGPVGGPKQEVCLNVAEESVARLYKRCGFLLDDDAKDPLTGAKAWYQMVLQGVGPLQRTSEA